MLMNLGHAFQIAKYRCSPLAIARNHAGSMLDLDILARAGAMRGAARAPARTTRNRSGRATIKLHGIAEGGHPGLYSLLGMGFSTTAIEREISLALMDDSVDEVVLSLNTPGGSVEGIPELVNAIRAASRAKVLTAMVEYQACSAGFWVASACDRIIMSPSAEVGSIGVYMAHEDVSGAMAKAGVKNTYISAGRYKVEGRSDAPLAPDAQAFMQSNVDKVCAMFVQAVALGRGVTRAEVEKNYGQGRSMGATAAKKAGMVDAIAADVGAVPYTKDLLNKSIAALSCRI